MWSHCREIALSRCKC